MDIDTLLKTQKNIFENHLKYLSDNILIFSPPKLKESIQYSLLAGGKRLRPILTYSTNQALGGNEQDSLNVGAAIEFIHTYSLIHDDLPAMDNDDYRRGRLTNHKVFGDAVAILAGDALLTDAFYILTNKSFYKSIDSDTILDITNFIAKSSGSSGMVGGQIYDILYENSNISSETIQTIHIHKTAMLITAAVYSGARIATNDPYILKKIEEYGLNIGLAFQIVDDILDITSSLEDMGKKSGSDSKNNKSTYPKIFGLDKSKEIATILIENAINSISFLGGRSLFLKEIALYILKRVN